MIPTPEQLAAKIEAGHVKRVDQGPLSIYNYTPRCTYDSAWDEVTTACRGLVLNRETGEVVALPWSKFFNHDEPNAGAIDDAPPVVTVKLDGSLGISYRYEGRLRWTTRGTFFSPQAAVAQRIWDERYSHIEIPHQWTVMVEIISPETRVVVRYDYEDLVVLGIRDRSGPDLPQDIVEKWAAEVGLRVTQRVNHGLFSAVQAAAELDEKHEGFVLRWGDRRLKVKGSVYVWIAHFLKLRGMPDKKAVRRMIADWWYFNDTESMALVPAGYRTEVGHEMAELDVAATEVRGRVDGLLKESVDGCLKTRKDVALMLKAQGIGGSMFGLAIKSWAGEPVDVPMAVYTARFDGNRPRSGE